MAHGIGPGDEVIVPETTWIATAAPITYVGATPVFADVEPDTWCISVESMRRLITPRTKAVIVVDVYGGFPDLLAIEALCAEHGIVLIEDSAEAAGGRHAGRAAGSFGAGVDVQLPRLQDADDGRGRHGPDATTRTCTAGCSSSAITGASPATCRSGASKWPGSTR